MSDSRSDIRDGAEIYRQSFGIIRAEAERSKRLIKALNLAEQ